MVDFHRMSFECRNDFGRNVIIMDTIWLCFH